MKRFEIYSGQKSITRLLFIAWVGSIYLKYIHLGWDDNYLFSNICSLNFKPHGFEFLGLNGLKLTIYLSL